MSSGLLPDHIEPLVDRLRAGDHLPIALPDVAAVTEILMRSLESYFKSIDLTLYRECQDLADYIEDARSEISSLSPDHDDSAGIPRAGQELDAIVEATESATETIMQSAEDLMSFDSDNFDEYKEHINTEVMKIFEACSFQDITGQRISKVVKTLNHVEDRVGKLIAILGVATTADTPSDAKPILDPNTSDDIDEEDLLNGPALAGEGIDQGAVDSLLDEQFASPVAADDASAEPVSEPAQQPEEEPVAEEEIVSAEAPTETEAEPASEEIAVEENVSAEPETVEAPEEEISVEEAVSNAEPSIDEQPSAVEEPAATAEPEAEPAPEPKKVEAANNDDGDQKETSQEDIDSLFG